MKERMNPTPRIPKNHQSDRLIRNQQVAGSIPAGGSRLNQLDIPLTQLTPICSGGPLTVLTIDS